MAKQMILSFDVENQTLKRKDENKIVEKSKNYVHAIFFFTEEWDDTQKAAIIENGGMRFKVYLENNECDIPNRAVSHDGFTITIVGEDEEKNITITTTDLFIAVQKNNASDIQEEYIKNITSDTLDLTREGENCNIEIPSKYVTDEKLSQELESYVDNESLEETLDDYAKETDLSLYATKQELNEKSKVVANPTLSGDEATLEGAEIDGIKYAVGGGGGKLYKHNLRIQSTPNCCCDIYTRNNIPFTPALLCEYMETHGNIFPYCIPSDSNNTLKYVNFLRLASSYPTNRLYAEFITITLADGTYTHSNSSSNINSVAITDIVTEV